MGVYKVTEEAKKDLAHIYEKGIENFGLAQARKYLNGMHTRFQMLADNLNLGRAATGLYPPELRRFPYESHTVFYVPTDTGILIIRVLGQRMDVEKHL